MGQNIFLRDQSIYFERFGSRPIRSWRTDHITCTILVKIFCIHLKVDSCRLLYSIIPDKIGQKLFLTGKIAFLSKNLCFQQPLTCYKSDLVTSTVIVKIPCGPYINRPLSFVKLDNAGKNRRKSLFHWRENSCFLSPLKLMLSEAPSFFVHLFVIIGFRICAWTR